MGVEIYSKGGRTSNRNTVSAISTSALYTVPVEEGRRHADKRMSRVTKSAGICTIQVRDHMWRSSIMNTSEDNICKSLEGEGIGCTGLGPDRLKLPI